MPRYVRETHNYDDGGFTTVGRVVDILSHSVTNRRVTVLVEKPTSVSFERVSDEVSTKGITMDADAAVPVEDEPTCAGKDGQCSRRVSEHGDRCWQHEDEL